MLSSIDGEEFTFVDEITLPLSLLSPSSNYSFKQITKKLINADDGDDHHDQQQPSIAIECEQNQDDDDRLNIIESVEASDNESLCSDEYLLCDDWRVYDYRVIDPPLSHSHSHAADLSPSSSSSYDELNDELYQNISCHHHPDDYLPSLRARHQYLLGKDAIDVRRRLERPTMHHSLHRVIHKAIGSHPRHLPPHQKNITSLQGYQSNKSYGSERMGMSDDGSAANQLREARNEKEERAMKINTRRGPYDDEKQINDEEDEDKMIVDEGHHNNETKRKKVKGWQSVLQSRAEAKARRNAIESRKELLARTTNAENRSSSDHRPPRRHLLSSVIPSSSAPSSSLNSSSSSASLDDSLFYGVKNWEVFRRKFYFFHKQAIHDALSPNRGTRVASIRFAPVNENVTRNFLSRLSGRRPSISFHGTHHRNMQNILDKGLLIPNGKNGINVINGSAYGVGVYSSRTAGYSLSYARDVSTMFVCAVIEGEDAMKSHGNILVAHSEDLIIPIFLLDFEYVGTSISDSSQSCLGNYSMIGRHDWSTIRNRINKRRTKNKNDGRRIKHGSLDDGDRSAEKATEKEMIIERLEELLSQSV